MMANKVRGWLVDLRDRTSGVVEFEDKLENLYQLCNCDTIDIVMRKIGRYEYDITCDDEALLKDDVTVTAYDSHVNPMLFGNLLLTNHDEDGNLSSLSDEQIEDLRSHCRSYLKSDGEKWVDVPCFLHVEVC